jgi:hypothetical protein
MGLSISSLLWAGSLRLHGLPDTCSSELRSPLQRGSQWVSKVLQANPLMDNRAKLVAFVETYSRVRESYAKHI